jgi:hypothetical protein
VDEVSKNTPRVRRQRSVTETLLSIVLGLEMFVVFFATIVIFGLQRVPPAVAFTGGAVLILLLIITTRLLRQPWGKYAGVGMQVVLIAIGFLEPLMFFIGAGFAAMYIYYLVKGQRIDAQKASWQAAQPTEEGA